MISVGGEQIDASTLPKAVVDALKEKADAELTAVATAAYPNLKASVAKKLYTAFDGDEEMKEALSGFNATMGKLLEEAGESKPGSDLQSATDKFDAIVKAKMAETGDNYHQAYAKVAATQEGKQLIKEFYTEKE